ncbi:MAG TPA: cupin [Candidatus Eisenbacteria bacterium]|nr:cupin [Candidatus Eisenbacteria bacterium]
MDFSKFDKSQFTTEGYVKKVEKPWGWELHWVPEGMSYMGKVLHIEAGKRLSLQIHDQKQETYWLISGECDLNIENSKGEMEIVHMEKGVGYTTAVGQKHRHQAVTTCDIIEASTGEIGTTWRLEDDYKRPDETEALRKEPNRGWKGK